MGAVGWLVGHELRARWRAVVGLALLVGLAGGIVLATAAGARRTGSAYERFTEGTATRDVSVQVDAEDPGPLLGAIEELALVAASGRLEIYPVLPEDESMIGEVDLAIFASPDGRYGRDVDRPVVLQGRMPSPDATDEVIANELAARLTGLGVGDRIAVTTFTPEQLAKLQTTGEFTGFGGPALDLEIVGVGRQANDLQGAEATVGGVLLGTRALQGALDGRAGGLGGLLALELAEGGTVDEVRAAVRDLAGPQTEFDVTGAAEDFGDATRDATQVLARALAAFAAVAGLAGAIAVGGAITRQAAQSRSIAATLGAVGCDRRQVAAVTASVPAVGLVCGTVLAAALAALASGRFPISVARAVEPDPGIRPDLLVLGGGVLAMVGVGAAWVGSASRRLERRAVSPRARRPRATLSLPPVAAIGVGHAFDARGDGRTVPVRAALAAAVLGVVGVVGAATVVDSFDSLVGDPARYGWTWSAEPDYFVDDPGGLAEDLASTEGVEAVAFRHSARIELDGIVVPGMAFESRAGSIAPALRSGRLPLGPDEVVVGAHTAEQLGVSAGDRVSARRASGAGAVDLEVVGIGVFAPVDATDPASGGYLTPEGLERVRRSDGFTSLLLRYESGFDPTALEASLMEDEVADFSSVYTRPRPSGALENLDRAMPVVVALGGFFVVLALLGVGHGLVVGTRRRRRELATLHALGMRRGQVRGVVVISALVTAAVGLVLGIPLGSAVGRIAWRAIIGGQGVIDAPSVPLVVLAVVVPVALAAAAIVASPPSARAGRDLAAALRSE